MSQEYIFCNIESDAKSFELIKLYKSRTESFEDEERKLIEISTLDNEIQKKEIETHLYLNRVPEWDVDKEQSFWVTNYAYSFRVYLNTLKILFLIFETTNTDPRSLTFEEFCVQKEKLNKNRAFLDVIHE